MNASHALAYLIIGWNIISSVWYFVSKPYTIEFRDPFYLVCAVLYLVAVLTLCVVVL